MSEKNGKPDFDEQTLARVLEAAYVLQEHNRKQRERAARTAQPRPAPLPAAVPGPTRPALTDSPAKTPPAERAANDDYTVVMAQIVEAQHQIQAKRMELESAMTLIVGRASEIAHADGAAIGILDGGKVRCRAAAGDLASPVGTEVPMEKALCTASLRIGQVIRCSDVNLEFLVDLEECRRRGIESMIAAPVYQGGNVVGALEIFYRNPRAFTEPDVHTCQLMAGLVSEVMSRSQELNWKKSLETERAAMREALEKLKPNLEALAERPAAVEFAAAGAAAAPAVVPRAVCQKCGSNLVDDEQFCGECGAPRTREHEPVSMQSKMALLWQMREAKKKVTAPTNGSVLTGAPGGLDAFAPASSDADLLVSGLPELFTQPHRAQDEFQPLEKLEPVDELKPVPVVDAEVANVISPVAKEEKEEEDQPAASTEIIVLKPKVSADWSSAATARNFLEQLAHTDRHVALVRFLKARRGDIYLALAVILVAIAIRWGIWSGHAVNATGTPVAAAGQRKAGADLPLFDRMLIKLGLADPPDPPEYKGNPNTQVWVDTQTALYYCPGADLYGKTPKGKLSSQRDAQLDSYEPAARKACD